MDLSEYGKIYQQDGLVKINNLFSDNEILNLNLAIVENLISVNVGGEYLEQSGLNKELGRFQVGSVLNFFTEDFSQYFSERLKKITLDLTGKDMGLSSIIFVKYSGQYGSPNLPPHFDGDSNDLIINYQLDSNITWELGLNKSIHELENNSALIFNPNTSIHWRPILEFKENDYVKMIFFRFRDKTANNDYSHLSKLMQNDMIYLDTERYRRRVSKK